MMIATAKLRHLRVSPRKVRLVADLIRGKHVEEALNILQFTNKVSSRPLAKLLKSAVANADQKDASTSTGSLSKTSVSTVARPSSGFGRARWAEQLRFSSERRTSALGWTRRTEEH